MARLQAQSVERGLNALVGLALLITGGFTAASLALSVAFEPAAIARGEHLASLGLSLSPCPGCGMCGMSRAFAFFSRGEVAQALSLNPGVVLLWPLFLAVSMGCAWGLLQLLRHPLRTHGPFHPHT